MLYFHGNAGSLADWQNVAKELLHFKVLDHIIVTEQEYFSFSEAGIIEDIKSQSA